MVGKPACNGKKMSVCVKQSFRVLSLRTGLGNKHSLGSCSVQMLYNEVSKERRDEFRKLGDNGLQASTDLIRSRLQLENLCSSSESA